MTTATRTAIEQIQRLSRAELDELQAWINEHLNAPTAPPAATPAPTPILRPDFAARLRKGWGDAPPMSENAVLAMRAEERN